MNVETVIVYADLLIIIDFCVDFLCLYITSRLLCKKAFAWRLVLGALSGGVWSLFDVIFPGVSPFISIPLHLCFGVVICLMAFGFESIVRLLRSFLVFVSCELVLGGVISGFIFAMERFTGRGLENVSALAILVSAIVAAGTSFGYTMLCRKRINIKSIRIEFCVMGETYKAELLVDSGNLVTEPFSALPVIFLKAERLPIFLQKPDMESCPVPLRAIPVQTAAGKEIFYGFKPAKLFICPLFQKKKQIEAVIAVDTAQGSYSGFDGLCPVSVL